MIYMHFCFLCVHVLFLLAPPLALPPTPAKDKCCFSPLSHLVLNLMLSKWVPITRDVSTVTLRMLPQFCAFDL